MRVSRGGSISSGTRNPRINAALREQLGELEHVMLAGLHPSSRWSNSPSASRRSHPGPGPCLLRLGRRLGHRDRAQDELPLTGATADAADKRGFVASQAAITARRSARCRSPTWRCSATPMRRCCDRRRGALPRRASGAARGIRARRAARAAQALEAHLAQHHATTAALIVEPLVQGAAGMAMHDPYYLARARELCDRYEVHLIADEICRASGAPERCSPASRPASRPTFSACPKASPAATCRCRWC